MSEITNISKHADLLNALDEMQHSVAYAARRPILAEAERTIDRLEKELAKANLSIDILRDGVNRVANATIPDHPQLATLTILGKIHAIGEAYGGVKLACQDLHEIIAALRSQVVEWKEGGAFGTSEPIPEPKWDFQQFILGTLEFSKQVELFHVEYGHRLQWVYKTPDLREWAWSDIVKWCSVSDFPLPVVHRT